GTGTLYTTGSVIIFEDADNNMVNYIRGTTLTSFDTIIINNSMGIIAETDIMVNGQIELSVDNPPIPGKGVLAMTNGSTLKMGENAITFGIGEVTGLINRTHNFNDNIYYSFGSQNSGVIFTPVTGQIKPSSITLKVTIGTAPDWSSDTDWNGNPAMSDAINRLYELSQTGGSGTRAMLRIHYRNNELPAGIDENKLTVWSRVATGGTPAYIGKEEGKSGHNTIANYIIFQDANFTFIPSTMGDFQATIAPSNKISSTWNGLISTDWNTGSNWDPTGVPTSAISVIIPNAATTPYSPLLPVSAECKSVQIESGGVLNAAAGGGTLSLSGADLAWNVASGGTFNAGTGTVAFTSTEGTISIDGTTSFHNLTIAAGTTLQPSANSYTGVSGVLSIDGVLSGYTNDNVIEFNGTDQNIPNPEGSKYHNLIIGGTGTKTFPANLYVAGGLTNNGTIDAVTNSSTLIMCGAEYGQSQIIAGTNATLFNNLTIQNGSTTIIGSPQKVSGNILVDGILHSDGFLTLISTASKTALVDGTGTGQISGNVTMERYLSSGMGYKYISSPFQSATVGELSPEIDLTSAITSVYRYDENRNFQGTPLSGWVNYKLTTNVLYPMVGYAVNSGIDDAPKTLDITGIVNNGPLSIEVSNNNNPYTKGFNLVGNPYPSPIDWDAPFGWTRTNIDDAIYFFIAGTIDQYEGSYSTYINGIKSDGAVSNIIPSMQGFFVHVKDGVYPVAGTLQMNNDVRVINQSQSYLKGDKGVNDYKAVKGTPVIRFTASFSDNTPFPDYAVTYFDPKSTPEFDGQLDALKLMNSDINVPNFYFVTPGDINLQIQALLPVLETFCKVPLGITIKRDGYVIVKIRDIDPEFSNLRISISDMVAGTDQDLLSNQEFKIFLNAGEYKNRFFLNITDLVTTFPDNIGNGEIFNIYYSQNSLHATINQFHGSDATLTIYNLLGQTLLKEAIRTEGYHIIDAQLKDGIYIATFVTGNIRTSKKIFIRNR
ncbi:MAG: T9SS type A sorting domain-containing protein, partial [Ignavibacteriaceae bacterium]